MDTNQLYFLNEKLPVRRPGHVFIYVLLFNTKDQKYPARPFYVGQAVDLKRRLANHAQLIWHSAKFEQKAKVFIAGAVPANRASRAEQDLISRLLLSGYWLMNKDVKNSLAISDSFPVMANTSKQEINNYLDKAMPKSAVLNDWKAQWHWHTMKTPRREQQGFPSLSNVQDYIQHLSYDGLIGHINGEIATAYNPETGIATVNFDKKHTVRSLRIVTKKLNTVWIRETDIVSGNPVKFTLTNKARQAILYFSR